MLMRLARKYVRRSKHRCRRSLTRLLPQRQLMQARQEIDITDLQGILRILPATHKPSQQASTLSDAAWLSLMGQPEHARYV